MADLCFMDSEHEAFYRNFIPNFGDDVYLTSVIYLLGLTEATRRNYFDLFDPVTNETRLDGLHHGWQTDTTRKITRLAFNLWNGMVYDEYADSDTGKVSPWYAPHAIFDNPLAPYFFEAIKLRYPNCFQK